MQNNTNTIITIIVIIILIVLGLGWAQGWFSSNETTSPNGAQDTATDTPSQNGDDTQDNDQNGDTAEREPVETIGTSVEGEDISAHHFGDGDTEVLFVGGIHGGYSWNTALVAHNLIEHLDANPNVVPDNVTATVIPTLNPDGLKEIADDTMQNALSDLVDNPPSSADAANARFNANGVDLNRNFACNWQSTARWQSREVDAGSAAFSEPEAAALRDYVTEHEPEAVVVWFSAAGGVYTSSCNGDVLSETNTIMNTYADASGYPAAGEFNAYPITGDATDWMAKEGIPAISVILETHNSAEWEKNRKGVEALLDRYAQ